MIISSTINKSSNACRDVISVRGVCGTATYPYYLDSLGISLNKASKLADSATISGKALIDEALDTGWGNALSDLRADGFKVSGVRTSAKAVFGSDLVGAGTYTFSVDRTCDIETIFANSIKIKTDGLLSVKLSVIYDSTETVFYEDDLDSEELKVNIDSSFNTDTLLFKVIATGAGSLVKSTSGDVILVDSYTQCSESLFYCKYWNYLVPAVMYKATAYILNTSLFSDRYNDFIVYKKDEIALRVAQLDSSYNLLNKEMRINEKGLYQLEIAKINDKLKEIVKQSYCTPCFECDNIISSRITIP